MFDPEIGNGAWVRHEAALGSIREAVGIIAAAAAERVVERPVDPTAAASATARVLDAEREG